MNFLKQALIMIGGNGNNEPDICNEKINVPLFHEYCLFVELTKKSNKNKKQKAFRNEQQQKEEENITSALNSSTK